MNPDTGTFHDIVEGPGGADVIAETGEQVPTAWPTFSVGEVFVLKGFPFKILRINRSSIVVQPLLGDKPARQLISALTTGRGFPLSRSDRAELERYRGGLRMDSSHVLPP